MFLTKNGRGKYAIIDINEYEKLKASLKLMSQPGIDAPLSTVMEIQTDYRFLVCANYLIFYRYDDGIVFVSRILYGRRDYIRILLSDLPEDEEK